MNTYKKYYANVFVAQCEQEYQRGDIIKVVTKHGKENEHVVHNLVDTFNGMFYYSITRLDGYNNQERAKNKQEKLKGYAENALKRGDVFLEKSKEGKDFLSLGEPIKVGHHSEQRHRNLIERNHKRMGNAFKEYEKAEKYENSIKYWQKKEGAIDLSMPESLEYFEVELEKAKAYHKGLKDGSIKKEHSHSTVYANKKVKELQQKYDLAVKMWG